MFAIENYINRKIEVIKLIQATHKWQTSEGFIADGIISPKDYERSKIKIAVLLAESYGYDNSGLVEIETQPDEDVLGLTHTKVQSTRKISSLLWLIYSSLDNDKVVDWDEIPYLFQINTKNTEILQQTLKNAAWINVKKASKPVKNFGNEATRLNYNEIYSNALKNKDILKIQLDSIDADFWIVCSDSVFNSLFDMGLLGSGIKKNKKWVVQTNELGKKIIHVSHPGYYRDWGYEGIYESCKIIYNSIK